MSNLAMFGSTIQTGDGFRRHEGQSNYKEKEEDERDEKKVREMNEKLAVALSWWVIENNN